MILEHVMETIKKHELLHKGDRVLVGVSGGPDSVCLLHVLHTCSDSLGISVYAVHVNHMLRGNEADEDQKYVESLCSKLGIPLYIKRFDVKVFAHEKGYSLEEAGREVRYDCFSQIAGEIGGASIAVAHNKNDQAETVLMHALRGAGLEGLKGMDYKRGDIIRPLLDIERSEIEEYCAGNSLVTRVDSSNLEQIYSRNKIRLKLIPEINDMFGVNLVNSMTKMASILKDENEYIEISANMAYNQCTIKKSDKAVELDIEKLAHTHAAILKRVIRKAVGDIKGSLKNVDSMHTESVMQLALKGRTGALVQLPGNIWAAKSYNVLRIYLSEGAGTAEPFMQEVQIPGLTHLIPLGAVLEATVKRYDAKYSSAFKPTQNSLIQFFDYELIKPGINIRSRKDGDIFKPYRSSGTKKLKEFFIDNKIEREIRDKIPLIAFENEVVWIIGYKTSDKFKVTDNTKYVLRLTYSSSNSVEPAESRKEAQ